MKTRMDADREMTEMVEQQSQLPEEKQLTLEELSQVAGGYADRVVIRFKDENGNHRTSFDAKSLTAASVDL